jgi:hypothetical protein
MGASMRRLKWIYFLPVLVIAACNNTDLFQPLPIDHVDITTYSGLVQVGDTLRVTAAVFNSMGHASSLYADYSWATSDAPGRITLEQISPRVADGSGILVRGQSVGIAHVEVTANGNIKTNAPIEVIPRIARIVISPSSVTIAVGDTARLRATVITSSGDTLTGHFIAWATNPQYSPVAGPGSLVVGWAPGTVEVTATLAGSIGRAQVTVIPRSL